MLSDEELIDSADYFEETSENPFFKKISSLFYSLCFELEEFLLLFF